MKNKSRKILFASICILAVFVLWTTAVQTFDVQPIGPEGSCVGFASLNQAVHRWTGVHMSLYRITDWLSLVPVAAVMGFGLLGLVQWIRRKHISKVDFSLLILGGFYLLVMAVYALFEVVVINHRPVLIDGILEASYPSSTTMLVLCVMPTTILQFRTRIKNIVLCRYVNFGIALFCVLMVMGRLFSGVHWVTDIVGGILLSAGLVLLYHAFSTLGEK